MSTLAEANRQYFDSISDSYDTKPWFAKTNQQVMEAMRARLDWIGIPFVNTGDKKDVKEVRLLDYASGTGLITRTLGPYVTVTRGIDVSPNMVTEYNKRARDAGIAESTVHAVHGNLFDKNDPSPTQFDPPEWRNFDIATVGFGFHHFEDVVFAARQLKERLRPGGVLVINDFVEGGDLLADEDGKPLENSEGTHLGPFHGHSHGHTHGHHHHHNPQHDSDGKNHSHKHNTEHDETNTPEFKKKMNASIVVPHFTIDGVKKFFAEAGFVDVEVVPLEERSYMEFGGQKLWRTIFIARGRKPVEEAGKSEL